MRFTIIGAGAVGGYFGAKLQSAGEDVTFLVKQRRFEELQKDGLSIQSNNGIIRRTKAHVVRSAEEIERCDVVIVAVKNYNLDQVLGSIDQLTTRGANVLSLMNGIEQFEKIRLLVPDRKIVGGVCHLESTFDRKNGIILQTGITPSVTFGSPSPEGKRSVMEVENSFREAGIKTIISENIIKEVWMKFIFITALSTITCMARSAIGPIVANDNSRKALEDIIEETTLVAKKMMPELEQDVRNSIFNQIEKLPQTMTASMERDLALGLPLEVENLQGFLVRKAREQGITIPNLTMCYNILKLYENGAISPK